MKNKEKLLWGIVITNLIISVFMAIMYFQLFTNPTYAHDLQVWFTNENKKQIQYVKDYTTYLDKRVTALEKR